MWNSSGTDLSMVEGDWGINLPITVNGVEFDTNDEVLITVKDKKNGDVILEKTYGNIDENTIPFELTEAESALLPVGKYVYRIDWYQSGAFYCNITPIGNLKVVDKA